MEPYEPPSSGRPEGSALDGDRVETLLDEIEASARPEVWQRVAELVEGLSALYGEGLRRTLAYLLEGRPLDDETRARLCGDDLLASLLLLHGLHPEPTDARVRRALEDVRPYLEAHRGDVELLGVEEDVAHLRLLGSCDGCASSSLTLTHVIEGAIFAAAPEVTRVMLEQTDAPVRPAPSSAPLVQIGSPRKAAQGHEAVLCELCAGPTGSPHAHVVDLEGRFFLGACRRPLAWGRTAQ